MRSEGESQSIVVVGGSLGAIDPLKEIVAALPADFAAAVFVVIHLPIEADGYLPKALARAGVLDARHAVDGEPIRRGRIYVAPPNYHLTVERHTVRVLKGPRENRHRPAIDPLFRTASRVYGAAVMAVVLSGNLDDGSLGMMAVRSRGGVGVVQDPSDAQAGEMPRRALEYAGADYILPAGEIGAKLSELICTREAAMTGPNEKGQGEPDREPREHEKDFQAGQGSGNPSVFACPECHGTLWELNEGDLVRYRCRVGHSFTEESLNGEMDYSVERALWAALRALEEKAAMSKRMVTSASGVGEWGERLKHQAEADAENAEIIRKMIFSQADTGTPEK